MPNIEIERKYIIEMPSVSALAEMQDYSSSEILQIYLASVPRVTHRIRARKYENKTVYTETVKVRIDKISAHEDEHEISEAEFERLRLTRATDTRELIKTRHVFSYGGQLFEIDIYPEWQSTAILEAELTSRETAVEFPDCIRIVREVSGDKAYSNASMSRAFPTEDQI